MNPIVVIPSRMASTRLPGKPLADIHGRPMIVHVLDRAREAEIGPVAVACGDPEIADAVRANGGIAVLTDPTLPRGSDRVHAALAELDPQGRHDVVVNLQGDLPSIPPVYLRTVLTPLADPGFDIATLVAPIDSDEEANLPSVVKAACAFDRGRAVSPALYFSRVPIPWGDGPRWHHIGIYAFRRAALAHFVCAAGGAAGTAGEPGTASRPGGRHAHRLRPRRSCAVRRRHAGRSGAGAPRPRAEGRRMTGIIAFQGVPGAYSDLACRVAYPDMTTLPCELFETAMDAVREGRADLAMLPCENSLAGRVPDIHHLLPESGLFVIGEHFHRVEHCLLGVQGRQRSAI